MTTKSIIEELLQKAIEERPSLFVIECKISENNQALITIDGDEGVKLQDCIDIHRYIENNIDREVHDFSLEVASCGATSPIKNNRQFNKNKGRTLSIKTNETTIEGTLVDFKDEILYMEWEAREPKTIGKGKQTVLKTAEIPCSTIKEAIVKITF